MRQHINISNPKKKANQSVWDVKEERNAGRAGLINLGNSNVVNIGWGLNKEMSDNRVFIMKIGDKEAYLSADEMLRYLRWV